jgi:hypothetical protein
MTTKAASKPRKRAAQKMAPTYAPTDLILTNCNVEVGSVTIDTERYAALIVTHRNARDGVRFVLPMPDSTASQIAGQLVRGAPE